MDDFGFSGLAVFFCHIAQLLTDDIFDFCIRAKCFMQTFDFLFQCIQLCNAFQNIFLIDVAQLNLRDIFRLNLINFKACHQIRHNHFFLLGATDNGNRLINIHQDFGKPFEQVIFFGFPLNIKCKLSADGIHAEVRPVLQNFAHAKRHGLAMNQHIKITAEAIRQRCHGEQLVHQQLHICAALEVNRNFQTVSV